MNLRQIPSFPAYSVTDNGVVYKDGSPIKIGKTHDRYPRVTLRKNGKSYTRAVHTLVAEAFIGLRPKGFDVCHNDGSKDNNHISNLRYDTRRNNCADAIKHGTSNKGSRHGRAKLDEKETERLIKRYKSGERVNDLAAEYGMHRSTLYHALSKRTWKHVNQTDTK